MATQYIINFSDDADKAPFVVQPGEHNQKTSLNLYGMGAISYGEGMMENLIRLLENFSSTKAPRRPTRGQIWFDSNTDTMKYQDGSAAVLIAEITAAESNGINAATWANSKGAPFAGLIYWSDIQEKAYNQGWTAVGGASYSTEEPTEGSNNLLWFDEDNQQLMVWNGSSYVSVAEQYVRADGDQTITGDLPVDENVKFVAYTDQSNSSQNFLQLLDKGNVGSPNDVTISSVHDVHIIIDNNDNDTSKEFTISSNASNDTDADQDRLFSVNENGAVDIYSGILDMNTNRVINLAAPTGSNDAVRKVDLEAVADAATSDKVNRSGDTIIGGLKITGLFGSGNGSAAGEGSFGLTIDNRNSTDAGGVLVFAGDNNNDENAFEAVNHYGTNGTTQKVFGVKATSGDTYIKGAVVLDGALTSNRTNTQITDARHVTTKDYVDTKVATVAPPSGATLPYVNYGGAAKDGDITVETISGQVYISIYGQGSWRQVFPAVYS